jgi:GNAT superfamily N-acetyltransferase
LARDAIIRTVSEFVIRAARAEDVSVLTETVRQGFESYRAFLPAGWDPPPEEFERARIEERLRFDDTWCVLALDGDRPAGHAGFLAARERADDRPAIAGLAHLWMLFIREPWWGSGLARRLHALTVAEAAARGYGEMRLFTPAAHARARAFYEREGWTTDGEVMPEPMLGLDLVEYRRPLP